MLCKELYGKTPSDCRARLAALGAGVGTVENEPVREGGNFLRTGHTISRNSKRGFKFLTVIGILGGLLMGGCRSQLKAAANALARAHLVAQKPFPTLDGTRLVASIVDVRFSPGESSPRHSHPCPLVAYLIEGAVRVHIEGQPEAVYNAGESFYEPPNGIHKFTQNLSTTDPARLVAFFLCDHQTPLTVPLDEHGTK
jgi:quercetin dioxygenase-like cupin family protein